MCTADAGELALAAEVGRLREELNIASCEKKALEAAFADYKAGERGQQRWQGSVGGSQHLPPSTVGGVTAAGHDESGHAAEQLLNQRFSNKDARRRKMRILSMDGGGARGLYTTSILARIAKEEPRLLDNIDLIAGTSTGAIIGMLLASGFPPDEIQTIFEQLAPKIFEPQPLWRRAIAPLFTSAYDADIRSKIFADWTDGRTFADIAPWLIITTFKVDGMNPHPDATIFPTGCTRWRPGLLTNIPRMQGLVEPDLPLTLHDCLMCESSSPPHICSLLFLC